MNKKWTSKPITISDIYQNYKQGNWKIPIYQRGFIWKNKMINKMLESILLGFPLGSIIIWNSGKSEHYILDGQQRTLSILKIRNNPFLFLSNKSISLIFKNNSIGNNILNFFQKNINLSKSEILDSKNLNFKNNIISDFSEFSINKSDQKVILNYLKFILDTDHNEDKAIISKIDIVDLSHKEAIDLFNRINTSFVKLNDYEILSASWSEKKYTNPDEVIINLNENLYKSFYSGLGITYKEIKEFDKKNLTPSEYIYGVFFYSLNKSDFFKKLFIEEKNKINIIKSDNLEMLLWIIRYFLFKKTENKDYLSNHKEMDLKLGIDLIEKFTSDELIQLRESLSKATSEFQRFCKPLIIKNPKEEYIYQKSNRGKNLPIIVLAISSWKIFNNNSLTKKDWQNISIHTLKDWFGSVFSKATTSSIVKILTNDTYLEEIELDQLKSSIKVLENNQRQTPDSRGFNDIAKYIISITYQEITNLSIKEFHFDHIVPFKKLEGNYIQGRNSLGNCGLTTSTENQKKKADFIPSKYAHDRMVDIFDNINKSKYKELLEEVKTSSFGKNELISLYEYRFNIITEKFMNKISNFILD